MKTIFFFYLLLIPSFIIAGIFFLKPASFPFNAKIYPVLPAQGIKYSNSFQADLVAN